MAADLSSINKSDDDIFDSKFASECNIAMKWTIKEDTLRKIESKKDLESGYVPVSKIPGVKYILSIYPNGVGEKSASCFIHLYLRVGEVKSINVDFTISIKSASKKRKGVFCTSHEKKASAGFSICTLDELFDAEKKYFVDGVMIIELEGILKPRGLKRKAPTQSPNILSQKLWERNDKDITILAKNQKLMIHKWVLTARSPVFEAMFNSKMKEANENQVDITDFTKDIVNIGVEFCYERDIKSLINDKNASELLRFSDKYDMADMKAIIESFLIENISETNVCDYANMSIASNCEDLREFCVSFLMKFIDPPGFLNGMDKLDYEIMKEIFQRAVNPISKTM